MKFVNKPIVVEAIQYTGENQVEISEFVTHGTRIYKDTYTTDNSAFYIGTLAGWMKVEAYDYIIKGIKGECYPCKPDIFGATYDVYTEDSKQAEQTLQETLAKIESQLTKLAEKDTKEKRDLFQTL